MDSPEYAETTDAGCTCTESKHTNAAGARMAGISARSAHAPCCAKSLDSCNSSNSERCRIPGGSAESGVTGWMVWFFSSMQ